MERNVRNRARGDTGALLIESVLRGAPRKRRSPIPNASRSPKPVPGRVHRHQRAIIDGSGNGPSAPHPPQRFPTARPPANLCARSFPSSKPIPQPNRHRPKQKCQLPCNRPRLTYCDRTTLPLAKPLHTVTFVNFHAPLTRQPGVKNLP